ncbi:MAG: hypothetical protein ACRC2R_25815 [Xenococcaceae cyanobacterium]
MANLNISNLEPAGSDLFEDNENFLADLNDSESGDVAGGHSYYGYYPYYGYGGQVGISIGNTNGNQVNISVGNVNKKY